MYGIFIYIYQQKNQATNVGKYSKKNPMHDYTPEV